jgi:peptidoglycan/xylan/chitin deacetylase (PgdA/CDA1 family)
MVNDQQVTVPTSTSTVADVLARAGIQAQPGMLRSVLTGRPLEPNGNPPVITVDGKPASLEQLVQQQDAVVTEPGLDTLEAVEGREGIGPLPGGAPDVERTLYQPGRPRLERSWVGKTSGEVLATLVTQPEVASQPIPGKMVALTFDDGPHPEYTPAVLKILREEGVRATFCVIGQHGREHPDVVRAVVEAGHTLCNHTANHRILPGKPSNYIYGQIAGGSEFITSFTGEAPALFRAPQGQVSPEVVGAAHAQGLRVLGWSVDSNDYLKSPGPVVANRVLDAVQPGSVVLLHDGGGDRSGTVAAVRPIIQGLKARGYTFATPVWVP